MTEFVYYEVYDVVYASPPPLQDIAAIAAAVQLWLIQKKHLTEEPVTVDDIPYCIPKIIKNIIIKFLEKLHNGMTHLIDGWLDYHYKHVFKHHQHQQRIDILSDFNDIVCDFDGHVHYVRTARRMMNCDKFCQIEKFSIACLYSFEEDIRRIWPDVSGQVNLDEIEFDDSSILIHYWIRVLRNELDEIPIRIQEGITIYDEMIMKCEPKNRTTFDYFFNRASLEARYRICIPDYGRFILPKFSDHELSEYITRRGSDLMFELLTDKNVRHYVFPIWMYIKEKINKSVFTILFTRLVGDEACRFFTNEDSFGENIALKERSYANNYEEICEIWRTASPAFKQSVIQNILADERLGQISRDRIPFLYARDIRLLFTVLLSATSEQRKNFWHTSWLDLFTSTRLSDFDRIMKLCFENDDEIKEFKMNIMSKYENINVVSKLYHDFIWLNRLLAFCCVDIQSCNQLKQQLLQSIFHDTHYQYLFLLTMNTDTLEGTNAMHEFINEAFNGNVELANKFRNEFISSPNTKHRVLLAAANSYPSYEEFFNTFEDETVNKLKKQCFEDVKTNLMSGNIEFVDSKCLQKFLIWTLGDEDQVNIFKQSLSPDEILHNVVKIEYGESKRGTKLTKNPQSFDIFISWYFNTPEKINEYKTRFTRLADVFKMFAPPTP